MEWAAAKALAKSQALARERGVSIRTEQADLDTWRWPVEAFDVVVAIFVGVAAVLLTLRGNVPMLLFAPNHLEAYAWLPVGAVGAVVLFFRAADHPPPLLVVLGLLSLLSHRGTAATAAVNSPPATSALPESAIRWAGSSSRPERSSNGATELFMMMNPSSPSPLPAASRMPSTRLRSGALCER